jgi:hypothetical protein
VPDSPLNKLIRAEAARRQRQEVIRKAALRAIARASPPPTRVFIGFDYDQMLFDARALGQQLRQSPRFSIENWSMREAAPERLWREEAARRLNRSDVMVIVVNGNTWRAPGVLDEVAIARRLRVPIRMVYPARIQRPTRVPAAEAPLRRWTHDNLEDFLRVQRRQAVG